MGVFVGESLLMFRANFHEFEPISNEPRDRSVRFR